MKLTPAASILTSTWPGGAVGWAMSSRRSASSPPGAWTRIAFIQSAVDGPHAAFRIVRARGHALGGDRFDPSQILRAELNSRGPDVFLQVAASLGPGNRHHVLTLGQQPRERELGGRAPLLSRQLLHPRDEIQVLREVRALEARVVAAPIVLRQVVERLEPPREEPSPDGAVGDEPDAQLAARRQDLVLGIAAPQRIFGLQRADRVHGVGAAQRR